MSVHIDLQSRETKVGFIAHPARLVWQNAGGTSDTALMYGYMPIMYFACVGFVL